MNNSRQAKLIPPPATVLLAPDQPLPADHLVLAESPTADGTLLVVPRANLRGWSHISGVAGTGKSRLLVHWGQQHLDNGWGLGVIAEKWAEVNELALRVPLAREGQVVWFYPGDMLRPITVNPFDPRLVDALGAADWLADFVTALWNSLVGLDWWTDQRLQPAAQGKERTNLLRVLHYSIVAMGEGGGTAASFPNLLRFLLDRETPFYKQVVAGIRDPITQEFWTWESLDLGCTQAAAYDLTQQMRHPHLRYLLGMPFSTIGLHALLDNESIFLAAVPPALGAAQRGIGTLLYHWLLAAAINRMGRTGDHPDFTLLVDGLPQVCHNNVFAPGQATFLSAAKMAVMMANQSTLQFDPALLPPLLTLPNRVVFQPHYDEAQQLVGNWGTALTATDLSGLDPQHCEVYISCAGNPKGNEVVGPFSAHTILSTPLPPVEDLGPPPAVPFVWPERTALDTVVNELAMIEQRRWTAQEQRDRDAVKALRQQGVRRLQELAPSGGADYERYAARRRERDQAWRAFLLAHPAAVPDKLTRIKVLSALAHGLPEFEAEYLWLLTGLVG